MGKAGGFTQFWGEFGTLCALVSLFSAGKDFCYFNSCAGGRQLFLGWCHTNQLPQCVYGGAGALTVG